ncbi:hypothetical protein QVD17_32567 [Tagetes erecta]|uniref:Myb/SANT-like DNA-binding domain-containing protein n=1 Tax=Tagetes erecta TaxID=13708 RepID=A0AAD8NK13_TARER|nr:hypothetical protein QVD17_32567 [Tagetes erecta]
MPPKKTQFPNSKFWVFINTQFHLLGASQNSILIIHTLFLEKLLSLTFSMENNGIFSNTHAGSGMLGLEMSLNHQQNPNFLHHHHHQPPFTGAGTAPAKYPYAPKQRASPISDEDEVHGNSLNFPATTDDSGGTGAGAGDGKLRKGSPWQRMKWTDNMVRLLIMVVFYVGDEVSSDQVEPAVKKKTAGAGAGVLQKKGKWKSVSNAMMERGFYVSPQQCEDKFNDLNKRYKRVNDILGKGTACKVVENQSLLETMDHIPTKLKEEVKKLLNSKHLFFREMCAYHNSCSSGSGSVGGVAGAAVVHHSIAPEVGVSGPNEQVSHKREKCVHSNDDEEEEDDEEEDDGGELGENGDHYHHDEEEDDGVSNRKRCRTEEHDGGGESMMNQFNGELSCVIQDLTKSVWEKRQWMKVKMMQLEEQKLGFEGETYELEKRRLRWVKFCWSREREMELEKMRNERLKLENERMVILLKQKEMELVDVQ